MAPGRMLETTGLLSAIFTLLIFTAVPAGTLPIFSRISRVPSASAVTVWVTVPSAMVSVPKPSSPSPAVFL